MNISYIITVADEEKEFRKLYETLRINKREEDNIIVLVDLNKCLVTSELLGFIHKLSSNNYITLIEDRFRGNFADWKNLVLGRTCLKEWLIFLDADELLPPQLIDDLPLILELNPDADVIGFPRANFVKGITPEHIKAWGWRQDIKGRINYPDVQYRVMKNKPTIRWEGHVHETLVGYNIRTEFPIGGGFDLLHIKDIKKQEQQNNYYNTL